MTRLAVPIMVQARESALAVAARAAERGADLVEFRVDTFTDDPAAVADLLARSPLPAILTCRPTWEGGFYDGDDQARLAFLEAACLGGPRPPAYLDIELAAYARSANLRQKVGLLVDHPGQVRPISTGLILSSHDFTGRPADLYQRIEAMAAAPACRVLKVAWRARSLRDNLEAFEIVEARHKPTVALCMGEEGLASRVLAKKFGALLTFAALDAPGSAPPGSPGAGTAPGQPGIAELKGLYRWDQLGPRTRVYGVIGHPVAHSMSPAIHNAGFDAVGHDGVYLPMPVPPDYVHFKATVGAWLDAAGLDFRGASVTLPHKENLLRFVRERGGEVEPLAGKIGAANTLAVRDDGSFYAANTDYAAALGAVGDAAGLSADDFRGFRGLRVAVIGAGGAARAIVAGFAHRGATVVIYNRSVEKARALAAQFDGQTGKVVTAPLDKLCDACCRVYINCTPMGMHPRTDETPVPVPPMGKEGWGPQTVVFDTIYNPAETRLLREARAAGCVTVSGVEMFVRQAAAQFALWTGAAAPTEAFRRVLQERLGLAPSPSGRGPG